MRQGLGQRQKVEVGSTGSTGNCTLLVIQDARWSCEGECLGMAAQQQRSRGLKR